LDLIYPKLSRDSVALGDGVGGGLAATAGQVKGDGPAIAIPQGRGDQLRRCCIDG
jgi:hypothetical protein